MKEPATRAQREGLVRLLGDDDPKIAGVAWEHLEELGEAILPLLEKAARDSNDARVRAQARRFLEEWKRREVFRQWVEFCKLGRPDLERGVFLIAQTEYPGVDVALLQNVLDGYAGVLRVRLRSVRSTAEAVARLVGLIFEECEFRGNRDDYYDPDNSYLNRVLEEKRGIPISLAVVVLLVARRLSIPVEGVGMPQHFLLKYVDRGSEVFVDAFHGGKLLTARDCVDYLDAAGLPFEERYLNAVPDREILRRMLGNLLQIYLSAEDARRSQRVAAMLKLLE